MASVMDTIYISLGLKTDDFKKSMDKAKENIEKTSQSLSKGADQTSAKAFGQLANVAKMVAAPLAGALSIGSMIKTYFSGVAQVAQMTGAYSTKLEEWRKKRALLNRVTKEDIALYKKSREAITKFSIVMDDLGAKIARKSSPAVKFFVEMLERVSDWIDKYSDDIVRFLQITAAVLGTLLLPQIYKMTAALLMNPITWIVAALVALIAVIDDFVVLLNGGESALGDFWSMFGTPSEVMGALQKALDWVIETLKTLWEIIKTGVSNTIEWFSEFDKATNFTGRIAEAFRALGDIILAAFNLIMSGWNSFVNLLNDSGFIDTLISNFFKFADVLSNVIPNALNLLLAGVEVVIGAIKGLLSGDWSMFENAVNQAIEAVKNIFKSLFEFIKDIFGQIFDFISNIFSKIGESVKNAISGAVNTVKEGASKLLNKVNPLNWFSDDSESKAGNEQNASAEKASEIGQTAEQAAISQTTENTSNTMYNSPTINMYNPSPAAVDETLSKTGANTENYGDYVAQMARSGT
jgi:hypothetical protein